jgi:hypothetical protein
MATHRPKRDGPSEDGGTDSPRGEPRGVPGSSEGDAGHADGSVHGRSLSYFEEIARERSRDGSGSAFDLTYAFSQDGLSEATAGALPPQGSERRTYERATAGLIGRHRKLKQRLMEEVFNVQARCGHHWVCIYKTKSNRYCRRKRDALRAQQLYHPADGWYLTTRATSIWVTRLDANGYAFDGNGKQVYPHNVGRKKQQ